MLGLERSGGDYECRLMEGRRTLKRPLILKFGDIVHNTKLGKDDKPDQSDSGSVLINIK